MSETKEIQKKQVGRPPTVVDMREVERLAKRGFSREMVAAALGVGLTTLYSREGFQEAFERGKSARIDPVLQKNYDKALAGEDKAITRELQMAKLLETGSHSNSGVQVQIINNPAQELENTEVLDALEGEWEEDGR